MSDEFTPCVNCRKIRGLHFVYANDEPPYTLFCDNGSGKTFFPLSKDHETATATSESRPDIGVTTQGWESVFQYGVELSLMPLKDWLVTFETATAQTPDDPEFTHDYIYKEKGEVIQDVLRAALVFKQAILTAQQEVKTNPRLLGK